MVEDAVGMGHQNSGAMDALVGYANTCEYAKEIIGDLTKMLKEKDERMHVPSMNVLLLYISI